MDGRHSEICSEPDVRRVKKRLVENLRSAVNVNQHRRFLSYCFWAHDIAGDFLLVKRFPANHFGRFNFVRELLGQAFFRPIGSFFRIEIERLNRSGFADIFERIGDFFFRQPANVPDDE